MTEKPWGILPLTLFSCVASVDPTFQNSLLEERAIARTLNRADLQGDESSNDRTTQFPVASLVTHLVYLTTTEIPVDVSQINVRRLRETLADLLICVKEFGVRCVCLDSPPGQGKLDATLVQHALRRIKKEIYSGISQDI